MYSTVDVAITAAASNANNKDMCANGKDQGKGRDESNKQDTDTMALYGLVDKGKEKKAHSLVDKGNEDYENN